MNFSLEITTKTNLADLPAIRDIYIVFAPGADYREIVRKCEELVKKGHRAVPHFPARSIKSEKILRNYVNQVSDAGVEKVLIIGGDREAIGPFHCSMQLIETGLFEGMEIAIAGHPEGSPNMSDELAKEALQLKTPYASHIVTQWCQNSEKIKRYVESVDLPVHIGIAGPASIKTLMKFASYMGLGNSMNFVSKNTSKVMSLFSTQLPDSLIKDLSGRTDNFHIYAFGGVRKINEWLTINEYV